MLHRAERCRWQSLRVVGGMLSGVLALRREPWSLCVSTFRWTGQEAIPDQKNVTRKGVMLSRPKRGLRTQTKLRTILALGSEDARIKGEHMLGRFGVICVCSVVRGLAAAVCGCYVRKRHVFFSCGNRPENDPITTDGTAVGGFCAR